ncbi:bifunctional hydroxymethylpyrimidine kinase/phosphomethylpyrimidine kinase [Orbaceae bacterium ESL0721]|nr:bifunctional hydroxymethylpyrimidine kinase/phosphomethylpyrimidine kinase [Orbaceae bacterium ESL0721]
MTITCLTIAGSDPSGGAGIQADIKTFSALGTYAMSVITALTAQNTLGVKDVFAIPPQFIAEQFSTIIEDITVDSLKIGMLMNSEIVEKVSELLKHNPIPYVVLDTVMIAKGGAPLLTDDAISTIRDKLLPLATIITPNLPEAAALLGIDEAKNEDEMVAQGVALLNLGCKGVLIKGGHLVSENSPDYFVTQQQIIRYSSPRIHTKNTHGTGCTLSAAIAALLPQMPMEDAIKEAKKYLYQAILHADSLKIGNGIGPTHHFAGLWSTKYCK